MLDEEVEESQAETTEEPGAVAADSVAVIVEDGPPPPTPAELQQKREEAEAKREEQAYEATYRWRFASKEMVEAAPAWAYTLMRMNQHPEWWLPTAATDGDNLMFNPEFTEHLTDPQLMFVLAHELLHVVFAHFTRYPWEIMQKHLDGEMADPLLYRKWNIACDYAIHNYLFPLAEEQGWDKPTNVEPLYDAKYEGMTAEQIYEQLPDVVEVSLSGTYVIFRGVGQGPKGSVKDGSGEGWVLVVDENGNAVDVGPGSILGQDAHGEGRFGGKGEGSPTDRFRISVVPTEPVDWKTLLAAAFIRASCNDYNWARPDSGYMNRGLVVPGFFSESPQLVIAIDISPSISQEQYDMFTAVVDFIRGQLDDHEIHLVFCDDQVRRIETVRTGEELDWHVQFRGGTDFDPVFKKVEQEGWQPRILVYLTDGEPWHTPRSNPEYHVIWALTEVTWSGGHRNLPRWGERLMLKNMTRDKMPQPTS